MSNVGVEELIGSSLCYGVAYDATVKECKICEVKLRCKAECEGCKKKEEFVPKVETVKPETKPDAIDIADKDEVTYQQEDKSATKKKPAIKKKPEKPQVEYEGMPDLKAMEYDDLLKLAEDRGLNLSDFDKYTNKGIKRMRVTMAIKKTFAK